MEIQDLVTPARVAITVTVIVCVYTFYYTFKDNETRDGEHELFIAALKKWSLVMGLIALIFTHTSVFGLPGQYLPFGVVPGFILAFLSLKWKPAQAAFDSLNDSQIRLLSSFRIIFGAFLLAGAAFKLFPPIFAITAGLGDLLAGWLALSSVRSLNSVENKKWRWLVHGWGIADLFDVAVLGTFVVRPWLIEKQSLGPSMLLPWMAVPLLLALNLHGVRKLLSQPKDK